MHTTISIPSDIGIQALARALATIGLKPTVGRSKILAFDHAGSRPGIALCQEPGCPRAALVSDGTDSRCAAHWLSAKQEQPA